MGGERATPGTQHPTEENIPVIEDPRFLLQEQDSAQQILEFTALPSHTIGINEGERHAMIGSISDIEFRRRAMYYADREYSEIRVYNHSGALLGIVGSPGSGPGEFSNLTRVAVTEDEANLFAWDAHSRVQVFGKRDSAFVLENSFHVVPNANAGDICVLNEHLYAVGYGEELEGVLHKYTRAGSYVASFGTPYKSSFSLVRRAMDDLGQLKCDERLGIIVHSNHRLPILLGYSENGDVVWRLKFADFRPEILEEGLSDGGMPSVEFLPLRKGHSRGYVLIRDQMGASLIVRYQVMGDMGAAKSVSHYFSVDLQTGEGSYLGLRRVARNEPRLLGLNAEQAYAVRYRPFPQIMIYKRSAVFP